MAWERAGRVRLGVAMIAGLMAGCGDSPTRVVEEGELSLAAESRLIALIAMQHDTTADWATLVVLDRGRTTDHADVLLVSDADLRWIYSLDLLETNGWAVTEVFPAGSESLEDGHSFLADQQATDPVPIARLDVVYFGSGAWDTLYFAGQAGYVIKFVDKYSNAVERAEWIAPSEFDYGDGTWVLDWDEWYYCQLDEYYSQWTCDDETSQSDTWTTWPDSVLLGYGSDRIYLHYTSELIATTGGDVDKLEFTPTEIITTIGDSVDLEVTPKTFADAVVDGRLAEFLMDDSAVARFTRLDSTSIRVRGVGYGTTTLYSTVDAVTDSISVTIYPAWSMSGPTYAEDQTAVVYANPDPDEGSYYYDWTTTGCIVEVDSPPGNCSLESLSSVDGWDQVSNSEVVGSAYDWVRFTVRVRVEQSGYLLFEDVWEVEGAGVPDEGPCLGGICPQGIGGVQLDPGGG